eukprot:TRINITY_DN1329_c0_g1_i18.p1 TRINITY_DN1329_c0_g1~~TRINITY_DN1329_c0_g1_i18.p1  ORF type:complete len:231 (-),score=45.75 TRINITY_DN1329_c0_g1_i18:269-961(-)
MSSQGTTGFSVDMESSQAEDELVRIFKKDHFRDMIVLGQFNLGFIIARRGGDIFIIDQHASDEKFNFETLQKSTEIHTQKLISPIEMELTVSEEIIVRDHLHIFKQNGFDFEFDDQAPTNKRVKLVSIPHSKNTQFGPQDVIEMICKLGEDPGRLIRPTRVTSMFASRACRSAVMIGTALDPSQMTKIVLNMAELEHPWNCPHGRPTMRHLIDLRSFPSFQSPKGSKGKH